MSTKRALVVDDSKSARVVLSRMLEKFGISVDTADSAEAALEFLKEQRPDVVFMDHLMPGMDGLEAVKLIKANPATATLPVMMYTSQEGELYAGQARALGAMGVLPKSVRPIDVTKVLYQLQLLPDRRDAAPPVLQPVDEHGVESSPPRPAPAVDADVRAALEAMLREQSLELRRFMVATLEGQSRRLVAELKVEEPAAVEPEPLPPPPAAERPWGWIVALAAFAVALAVLGWLYWQTSQTAAEVEQARSRLETEAAALRATLDEVRAASQVVAPAPGPRATAAPLEVIPVPYGEAPLAPSRLEQLTALVRGLEESGFQGTVRVEAVAGRFCLTGSPEAGYAPASPALAAGECDYRGNPFDEQLNGSARQPVSYANLAADRAAADQWPGGAGAGAGPARARPHALPAARNGHRGTVERGRGRQQQARDHGRAAVTEVGRLIAWRRAAAGGCPPPSRGARRVRQA